MKSWLKFEINNYKFIIIGMILFIYIIILPYTMRLVSFENELEVERIFTQVKYCIAIIEIGFLYIMSRHLLGEECIEVIFSIKTNKKYFYILVLLIIFIIICLPLFMYYYWYIESCLYDILDCLFLIVLLAHLFYAITFISQSLLISLFTLFFITMICNNFHNNAFWNIFHPMIRAEFINPALYFVYTLLSLLLCFTAYHLEKKYVYS